VAPPVFEEALTTVVRHAGAASVWLTVAYERRLVRITLADNGRGFDTGLSPQRSSAGQGTEVILEIPLGRRGA
jgi:two-component system NarL family sensor kinase